MSEKVKLFVGTRKGGFIFSSDLDRRQWQSSEICFPSWYMMHMRLDPRDQRLHTAVSHFVYGPTTHYSDDFGASWTQARQVPAFERASRHLRPYGSPEEYFRAEKGEPVDRSGKEDVTKVWNITPAGAAEPGKLYAGVEPGALFVSTDRGETWQLNEPLFDHPQRPDWGPGAGGLCLHTILPDPHNPQRLWVGISAGGCYRTDDGGQTWRPVNKNVRADYNPDPNPEFGHCVHKIALHPDIPGRLYQQNHCGVYRSDDGGENWIDIGEGRLPSRFGFPVAVHPHDPNKR
ncbi:MAG: WD40/YVTN/BNR-like repeat-containing protein [Chloroflexota bacterium]